MNFWERVDILLDNKGVNKKALAMEVRIDPSNITKGIKDGNVPSAQTAVEIAKFLNTTVEYLVTGEQRFDSKIENLDLYHKYQKTISNLDSLPEYQQKSIENMISEMSSNQQ